MLTLDIDPSRIEGYSRLVHLANALRGNHDSRRLAVVLVTGYFDASGAPDQFRNHVLMVGGFVALEDKWRAFEPRWTKTLKEAGVTCFHMTEFISCSKEFKSWRGQNKKREKFLSELCQIVIDTVQFSFGSGVSLYDWNLVNSNYELEENDFQPYALTGWSTVGRMRDWCKQNGYTNPLYVFEHGDLHQQNLRRRVEKDFGILIHTALKVPNKKKPDERPVIQLQSADFAAWQLLNVMREFEKGRDFRNSAEPWLVEEFRRLFSSVHYDHSYFSMRPAQQRGARQSELGPSLLRVCRDYGVAARKRP